MSEVHSPSAMPTLETERLILRPFTFGDAKQVQVLAGHALIAATTGTIPHPYLDGMAEAWIESQNELFLAGKVVQFAAVSKGSGDLIGNVSLFDISKEHGRAEVGYWIAVDEWGKGYGTEVARAAMKYGLEVLKLNKITARYISTNEASGKIMERLGMKREGLFRQHARKNGVLVDVVHFGLLANESSL